MPINPNALAASDTSSDVAPDGTELGQSGGAHEDPDDAPEVKEQIATEGKRTRRTKKQMIADAVVPADDAQVELKDAGTGAKIQRPWLVAVEMVREGKAEWADKAMKYALMKYDQQKAAPAFEPPKDETEAEKAERLDGPYGLDPAKQTVRTGSTPPDAEVGDEVLVNDNVFRVGHGGILTNQHSPISIEGEIVRAKRRWQRGADNEWRSADLEHAPTPDYSPTADERGPFPVPDSESAAATNGKGDGEVHVQSERLPRTQEPLEDGSIKIGTGILEKIGMPDYSSFQVGPITISRTVFDDGRRTVETFDDGREREVITAAVEGFDLLDNTVEFVAKRFRGQLISFLEATGSLKQPVS